LQIAGLDASNPGNSLGETNDELGNPLESYLRRGGGMVDTADLKCSHHHFRRLPALSPRAASDSECRPVLHRAWPLLTALFRLRVRNPLDERAEKSEGC
jgi:hypothetical protein